MAPIVGIPGASPSASTTTAAPSRAQASATPANQVAIPRELLDGGEVVILAIKPSLWFVVFDPLKWIGVTVLLLLGLPWLGGASAWHVPVAMLSQAIIGVAAIRVFISVLRWVSRFYVLTNRRVMCVRGVFRARCWSCPLLRVQNTRLIAAVHEKIVKLATLDFVTDELPLRDRCWHHIARPDEVHAEVRRAIAQARGG